MSNGLTVAFQALMIIVTATIFFLWKIFQITFPHWRWREDHFGREIRSKLTKEEWSKVKQYRLYFFLGMIASFILFGLLTYMNDGPF
jgi:hypothetical protein